MNPVHLKRGTAPNAALAAVEFVTNTGTLDPTVIDVSFDDGDEDGGGPTTGTIVVTAATVILVVTTLGVLILGFLTSAGGLMHLPQAVIAGADGLAVLFLMWLAWLVGRAAWRSERDLAMREDATNSAPTAPL